MNAMPSNTAPLRVLIVEDSADDAELMELALRRGGLRVEAERVDTQAGFIARIESGLPDLILCDFHLPRFSCNRVLEILDDRKLAVPLVVVSRHIAPSEAREMLRLGARACVMKNRMGELVRAVDAALKDASP